MKQLQIVERVIKWPKQSTDLDVDSTDPQYIYSLFGKKKEVVEYFTDKYYFSVLGSDLIKIKFTSTS